MSDTAIRAAERSGDTYALAVALIRAGRATEAVVLRGGFFPGDIVKRKPGCETWTFAPAGAIGVVILWTEERYAVIEEASGYVAVTWPTCGAWPTLELVEPAPP